MVIGTRPTFGELIDMYEEFEWQTYAANLLCSKVSRQYSSLSIGRPSRFYDTVQRIVGPTKPSLRGEAKLTGSPLASYRRRVYEPHIRNKGINL